mmetsp:Transcript_14633/g.20376  ORF Transcript_14633/g.20376 Transcript_14633/m.20376 type:complete len:382 (-) Transcript_14633:81-1226(-)
MAYFAGYPPLYYPNVTYPYYIYSYGVQTPVVPFVTNEIPTAIPQTPSSQPFTLEDNIKNYALKTHQPEGRVLSQLLEEFQKYVLCFTHQHSYSQPTDENDNNTQINNEITLLRQSTEYLRTLVITRGSSSLMTVSTEQESQSSPRSKKRVKKSPNPQPQNTYTPTQPRGVVIEKDDNGNVVYKVDNKPIRFKVIKNRPKNGAFSNAWEWHYQKLVTFKSLYGHTNVTRSVEGYEDIGTWVAEQRRKIKKGRITWDQFEKLNIIGFEWDRSHYFYNTLHKKPRKSNDQNPLEESQESFSQATEEQLQHLEEEESDAHTDREADDMQEDDINNQQDEANQEEEEEQYQAEATADQGGPQQGNNNDNSDEARSQEAPDTGELNE